MIHIRNIINKVSILKDKNLLILILIIFSILTIIIFTFRDYGKTWDEDDTIELGNKTLDYYMSFGKNTSYFTFYKQDTFYLTRGPIIEMARSIITRSLNMYSFGAYHFTLALFSLSAYFFLYKIIYLLTKNVKISFISIFLLLLMPRFYGNTFNDSKDIAPVYILLGVIYFSIKYFLAERRVFYLTALGFFFAVLTNLKIIFLYVYCLFLIFATVEFFIKKGKKLNHFILNQTYILLIFLALFYTSQPYLHRVQPFIGIKNMIMASENFPQIIPVLFEGISYSSKNLPWYYLPKWILISTPLVTLIFFIIGNITILKNILFKRILNPEKFSSLYICAIFWGPLLLTIYKKPIIYDSWRHFLFLCGPLIILTTLGFYAFIKTKNKLLFYLGIFLFGINVFYTGREMIKLHPYEYIYFNSTTGGLKGAYGKFETDYWGASFKEATEWIFKNKKTFVSSDGNIYIYPCLPHLAIPYIKPGMIIDEKKATLDYFFTRNHPLCKKHEGTIIHIIQREGIPLNIIKKRK